MPKAILEFKSEEEERQFWTEHDSTEHLDWDQAESVVFPKVKPSTTPVSLHITKTTTDQIR